MADIRLTPYAIQRGLLVLKKQYEASGTDYSIVFKDGEYGKGQIRTEVSVTNLLSDALELLKENGKQTEYDPEMPCNKNGCDAQTRASCCGCPEQLEYERNKKKKG